MNSFENVFTPKRLAALFPAERSDQFFDALYGDAAEGAYDIELVFEGASDGLLRFAFHLNQRSGRCLACNLTYGLPEVFSRHPIINIEEMVKKIVSLVPDAISLSDWELGATREVSLDLHLIPLKIHLTV